MTRLLPLALVLASLVASLARADQCQLVDREVAERALRAIRASRGRVLAHCAPCGDPPPSLGEAFVPGTVNSTGSSLLVDGTERDLAYLYLEVAPNLFENIALRAGCPAEGIPEVWDFRSGTARPAAFGPPPASLRRLGWGTPAGAPRPPLPG
jgi:hypothetical protein